MEYFFIVGYDEMQSHTKLRPPWIKLQTDLMDDYNFQTLSDAHKYHFIGLMHLASQIGNRLPKDPVWLAKAIGATEVIDLDVLKLNGLISEED